MSEKGMYQLLLPFAAAVVVFIAFYALGVVSALIGLVGEWLQIDFVEDIFEALTEFFFILRDGNSAGIVVSILVWIILTIVGEIWITQEYE